MALTVFSEITPLPERASGTKPDADGELWNTRYTEVNLNFELLEGGSAGEFWQAGGGWSVPAGTGITNGHVIYNNGAPLTQRANLDFIGSGFVAGNGVTATEIEIKTDPINAYRPSALWVRKTGDNSVIQSPTSGIIEINGTTYTWTSQVELDVDVSGDWDTITPTNYSTAANRAGQDFYIYAIVPASGTVPDFILSANSTVPDGETADTSRKVGGFHCECADIGTISGHDLSGYLQGDILPLSVWDLIHRPVCAPEGRVYNPQYNEWVDIYLPSDDGAGGTESVYGATILNTTSWLDFNDKFATVKMSMLTDAGFQSAAAGSNEETDIAGSADPMTTGGHSDTAGRRMVSNIGCEDMAGALWQWLVTPAVRLNDGTVGGWYNLPGSKGSFYTYGSNRYGNVQLIAGASWGNGVYCGSRSRKTNIWRWYENYVISSRGRSDPMPHRFL